MNHLCDEKAKLHRKRFDNHKAAWRVNYRLSHKKWSVHAKGVKFTQANKEELYEIARGDIAKEH